MNARSEFLAGWKTEAELAADLGKCEATVARWRKQGIGPPYTMNGREPIYNVERAQAWLAAGGTANNKRGRGRG
jgi:hypothetical protein